MLLKEECRENTLDPESAPSFCRKPALLPGISAHINHKTNMTLAWQPAAGPRLLSILREKEEEGRKKERKKNRLFGNKHPSPTPAVQPY